MPTVSTIEFDKFIASILDSIVKAEERLIQAYVDGLNQLFFEEEGDSLKPRTIKISYRRFIVSEEGDLTPIPEEVVVPLISLVPYRPLSIDDVEIRAGYNIAYVEKGDSTKIIGLPGKKMRRDESIDIDIVIRLKRDEEGVGYGAILNMLSNLSSGGGESE